MLELWDTNLEFRHRSQNYQRYLTINLYVFYEVANSYEFVLFV